MQESAAVMRMPMGADALESEFERIDAALARLAARAPDDASADRVATLEVDLRAERDLVAQLQDRIGSLRRRGDASVRRAEAERDELAARLAETEWELRRALSLIDALREASERLRAAQDRGGAEAAEVDAAMQAELDAVAAAREADRRDIDALLAELRPLIEGR